MICTVPAMRNTKNIDLFYSTSFFFLWCSFLRVDRLWRLQLFWKQLSILKFNYTQYPWYLPLFSSLPQQTHADNFSSLHQGTWQPKEQQIYFMDPESADDAFETWLLAKGQAVFEDLLHHFAKSYTTWAHNTLCLHTNTALTILRPGLAGGLINWPFHRISVNCVSGLVCAWIWECIHMHLCVSASVHCLSRIVFGFFTERCCHSPWKHIITAHSLGMNAHPYTSTKMWHFKTTGIIELKKL